MASPEVAQKMIHGDLEAFRVTLMLSIDHPARYYISSEPSAILQGAAHRQSRGERTGRLHVQPAGMRKAASLGGGSHGVFRRAR